MASADYLGDQLKKLSVKIGSLNKHKSEVGRVFEAQRRNILEMHAQLPEWSMKKKKNGACYAFHFNSPSTGEPLWEGKFIDLEAQLELNTIRKLKFYQWLLVEAYEAIEDFIEAAYAYCGFKGLRLWEQPKTWNFGSSASLDRYLDTKVKGTPYVQLRAFRNGLPHFSHYESINPNQVDYRVVFVLVEKLRHLIVHNEGYGQDLDRLVVRMLRELPHVDAEQFRSFVDSFFIPHDGKHLIDLLEFPVEDPYFPVDAFHDQMLGLFRNIMEYAVLIAEAINMEVEDGTSPC